MKRGMDGSDPEEVVNVNGGTVVDEFARFHEQTLHVDSVSVQYEHHSILLQYLPTKQVQVFVLQSLHTLMIIIAKNSVHGGEPSRITCLFMILLSHTYDSSDSSESMFHALWREHGTVSVLPAVPSR